MTENNNLVTSTQGIIKEALHKLGFDDGMYDLIKEPIRFLQVIILSHDPIRLFLLNDFAFIRNCNTIESILKIF
jgi:hypothetical protein